MQVTFDNLRKQMLRYFNFIKKSVLDKNQTTRENESS